jgi:hypothetical protein
MRSSSSDTGPAHGYQSHRTFRQLIEYIRIPNKSPMFDKDWVAHGHMDAAVELMTTWARAQDVPGMQVEVVRLDGRTPLIFIDIPASADAGTGDDCILLYGHLDKQPEMTGWDDDLGSRATASTAAAAPTTATPSTVRSPRSSRCANRASRTRAAW